MVRREAGADGMARVHRNDGATAALRGVLAAAIGPIDQQFLHSRMLRAWGHSKGMARNGEWIGKMRRAERLVSVLWDRGGLPAGREAEDIAVGADARAVLEADAAQTRRFAAAVETARAVCADGRAARALDGIAAAERADLAELERMLAGPEADETPTNVKHLMPKPGGAETAAAAIDGVLPAMTSAVSQIFFHSLIFGNAGRGDLAGRELDAALRMMYRAEALLERLLDLGGLPSGAGHAIRIGEGERGADETALAVHDDIVAGLDAGLATLDGLADPMTHTLFDGVLRAEREDRAAIAARLAD